MVEAHIERTLCKQQSLKERENKEVEEEKERRIQNGNED